MRERRQALLPSVLALTFVALLFTPLSAMAASGLPVTITMTPESASPGSSVEIVGLDFPASEGVELQLTTTAGPVHLATATTEEGGYFRQKLVLPADVAPGFWELRATGSNGAVAVHIFEAGTAVATITTVADAEMPIETASSGSPSGANLLVLVVLFLLIGGITAAAAFAYYQVHRIETDPGMATGDDPIWGGAPTDP
jgi:hypothetical protein